MPTYKLLAEAYNDFNHTQFSACDTTGQRTLVNIQQRAVPGLCE